MSEKRYSIQTDLDEFPTHDGPINWMIHDPDKKIISFDIEVSEWGGEVERGIMTFHNVKIVESSEKLSNIIWDKETMSGGMVDLDYEPTLDSSNLYGVLTAFEIHPLKQRYKSILVKFRSSHFTWEFIERFKREQQ